MKTRPSGRENSGMPPEIRQHSVCPEAQRPMLLRIAPGIAIALIVAGATLMRNRPPPIRFDSILCGIDFSRHSAVALRYAAALAEARAARLTAIFAVDPLLSAAAAAAYNSRRLADSGRAELQRFVRTTLGRTAAASVRCIVAIGKPERVVLSAARRLRADLIVVGTHGRSGISRMFFGSTTEAVLRRSSVPVLAVSGRCRQPRAANRQSSIGRQAPAA